MKLIYMADGLFLYETDNGYVVKDQDNNILKQVKHRWSEETRNQN